MNVIELTKNMPSERININRNIIKLWVKSHGENSSFSSQWDQPENNDNNNVISYRLIEYRIVSIDMKIVKDKQLEKWRK